MALTLFEIHRLETCEMVAWEDLFRAAPDPLADSAGIRLVDCEHGLIGSVQAADVLALNRVLGLGVRRDASPSAPLALIQAFDERAIARFFVPLSPAAQPQSLANDLRRYGLRHYNNWVRLVRGTSDIPQAESKLDVRRIDNTAAETFGRLVCRNFSWPNILAPWIAATVGRPNWTHYMAYDGESPVATAAMYRRGRCAWFDLATTQERHRGRGCQSTLLTKRLADAAAAGCDMVTMETAEEKPGYSAPSFRNAIRLGFEVAFIRPNYIWERAPSTG